MAVHAALAGCYLAAAAAGIGSDEVRSIASCALMLEASLFAAWAAVCAARGARGRRAPTAWWLLAAGCSSWSLTQGWWTFLEIAEVDPPALMDVAGLGYAALPLLALPALRLLVARAPGTGRSRHRLLLMALDVTALSGAVLVLGWALALQRALEQDRSYPVVFAVGDVLIAITVLALLVRHAGGVRPPLQLAASGLVLVATTDITYVGQALVGRYVTGTPLDAGWMLGFLLITAGANASGRPTAESPVSRLGQRLQLLMPYVPVALAVGIAGVEVARNDSSDPVILGLAMGIVVVASVRQGLTLSQNADLIDELAVREVELRRRALEDPLTGLGNRALLVERLEAALADPRAPAASLLYIDLDDFKLINDTHGHEAGDHVLVEVAARLAALVGPGETVARLGGDEFAVLLAGRPAEGFAAALLAELARPVVVGSRRFVVNGSVGLVRAEGPEETAGTLLSHADIAMYTAKGAGKGRVAAVHGADRAEAARKTRVRELVAHPELAHFSVVYQPVVALHDGRVRGVEALVRWCHPEVGHVSPVDFIHLAEQAGSINAIGEHVLTTALRDLALWQRSFPDHRMAMGVNVSPLQLCDGDLLDTATTHLQQHGLSSDQLVLEITEESLVGDIEQAAGAVAELRRHGISVAIDDFGTGYSSLRYLDRFDADVLKIDRSFVAKMSGNRRTHDLVRTVADLGRTLELQTIAEGVETFAELRLLREMGCELAQGYLFSRPVPAASISELLAEGGRFPLEATAPAQRPAGAVVSV